MKSPILETCTSETSIAFTFKTTISIDTFESTVS